METERDQIINNGSGKQEWIDKLRGYDGITSLDRELVAYLIERVEVFDNNTIQVTYRFQKAIEEMECVVELYSERLKEAI